MVPTLPYSTRRQVYVPVAAYRHLASQNPPPLFGIYAILLLIPTLLGLDLPVFPISFGSAIGTLASLTNMLLFSAMGVDPPVPTAKHKVSPQVGNERFKFSSSRASVCNV